MEFPNSLIARAEKQERSETQIFSKAISAQHSGAARIICRVERWRRSKVEGEQSSEVEGEDQTSNKFAKHSDVKWNFTPSYILFSNNLFFFFYGRQQQNGEKFFFGWNEATGTVLAFSHVEAADYQNVSLTSAVIWAGGSIWAVLLKTLQDAMSLDWHFAQSTPENIFPIARFLIIQTLTVFAISLFFP